MNLKFSQHIFEKYSNIKFDEKLSSGSWVPRGRTDRRDEANSHFSQILQTRRKLTEDEVQHRQASCVFTFEILV